jgi:ParB family chromosome partitioning protein
MVAKRGLGRGLNELLSTINKPLLEQSSTTSSANLPSSLPIDVLQPGKYQPRKDMDTTALQELADSIRAQGIIQPIVVRKISPGRYEIIAGERRWRAAQLAELENVPVVIRDIPDEAAIAMALIENIQRENLNAIEEANALQRLGDEFGLTHEQIAQAVGKSRATVTNLLRLLGLNHDVKTLLEHGDIEMGHSRALLALPNNQQSEIAKQVANKGLSVRDTEQLIRRLQTPVIKKPEKPVDVNVTQLENSLGDKLGASVAIQHNGKGKGKLVIDFNTLDELDGILAHIR